MLKKSAVLFLLLILSLPVFAQYDYNQECKDAYSLIIDLRFDAAQKKIEQAKKENPENLIPLLLENYIDFLRITLSEDKALFEQKRTQKKIRIDQWEKGPKDNPYYRMGIAQMDMQWAFSRVVFGEYITAAIEINQAYHLLEENKRLYPDFLPNALGLGVLHAMIGVVPDQYQWAVNFLGLYGSIDQGLNELEDLLNANKAEFQQFKPEALFLFTFLKLNLQTDPVRYTDLNKRFKDQDIISKRSPLLNFARAVLIGHEDNNQLIPFLENRPQAKDAFPFYYPEFMLAQAKLYKLNPEAQGLFNEYLENYPGNNFKRSAAQKQAWSSFIQGDTIAYQRIMNSTLTFQPTKIDADDAALKEAKKANAGYLPNLYLLKSRILFDGGYLNEALEVLKKSDLSKFSEEEKIELVYRKGRIYHNMDSLDQALTFYSLALSRGEKLNSYFAGNACLKMGEIYEQKKEKSKAELYYTKCLGLDFDEYRRSIRAKAKAGLQRLKAD